MTYLDEVNVNNMTALWTNYGVKSVDGRFFFTTNWPNKVWLDQTKPQLDSDDLATLNHLLVHDYRDFNIDLHQTCLSRAGEMLEEGSVTLAVASERYPLSNRQSLSLSDLEKHQQIVIRDGGLRGSVNSGWLGAPKRMTVTDLYQAKLALEQDLGFAWLPEWFVMQDSNVLARLRLESGAMRSVSLQYGLCTEKSPESAEFALLDCMLMALDKWHDS